MASRKEMPETGATRVRRVGFRATPGAETDPGLRNIRASVSELEGIALKLRRAGEHQVSAYIDRKVLALLEEKIARKKMAKKGAKRLSKDDMPA